MKTILLADDEANLRNLVHTTLNDPDYRILEATDGTEVLEIARKEHVDLLVMDWMMHGVDGNEVVRSLRQDPATAQIPVIMLTAAAHQAIAGSKMAPGACTYLLKPFSPLELLQKVQEAWGGAGSPGARAASESPVPDPPAEVLALLDTAESQLALYARDLRRTVDAERQKSRELTEANARLQILDRLKSDFLAFISHELRTPLVAMSAIDLVDPYAEPQIEQKMIDIVRNGYERLQRFIQKGLKYFAWLSRERREETHTTDLARLVREIAERTPGLAKSGVNFQLNAPSTPCPVRGEAEHLEQVVETLLDNALKFSPQQKFILLDMQATAENVTLAVSDNGQGFPPEMGPELFRPFTIADVEHHSRGTGLSLALAAAIVGTYGGHFWAASELGKGSTFSFTLPMSAGGKV